MNYDLEVVIGLTSILYARGISHIDAQERMNGFMTLARRLPISSALEAELHHWATYFQTRDANAGMEASRRIINALTDNGYI